MANGHNMFSVMETLMSTHLMNLTTNVLATMFVCRKKRIKIQDTRLLSARKTDAKKKFCKHSISILQWCMFPEREIVGTTKSILKSNTL